MGQPFGSYVMEHVRCKISYPAEFHAQTAVEAAMTFARTKDILTVTAESAAEEAFGLPPELENAW